jgi:DMSO/TMAO reductase YedYZ molybdopterin-dependent catalytic subunit
MSRVRVGSESPEQAAAAASGGTEAAPGAAGAQPDEKAENPVPDTDPTATDHADPDHAGTDDADTDHAGADHADPDDADPDHAGVPARLSAPVGALIGLLALAAALAAGHLVAGLLDPNASPYLAVGDSAIDLTPPWLKSFAVNAFGTNDKLVLLLGMAVVLIGLGALAGVLSRRRSWPGSAMIVLFGAVGVAAVLNRPDVGQLAVAAPVVALGAGFVTFAGLHRMALAHARAVALTDADEGADTDEGTGTGTDAGTGTEGTARRRFLLGTAGAAVGAAAAGGIGQLLAGRVDVQASRAAVGAVGPATPASAIPAGADFVPDGTPAFLTRNDDFYRIDTALTVPRLRAETWTLAIHGMVANPITLNFQQLRDRGLVEKTITLCCVSNEVGGPYISTASFTGVPLRDLIMQAGPQPGADQLLSTSTDGFTASTPLDVVLEPDRGALLAIGMNGEPLPEEHGFPVRMVVPGLYGYVSATKWLADIEVTTFAEKQAYWTTRSYSDHAPIKTESRIDAPNGFDKVPAGTVTVAGVAWAQHRGIDKVEVRVDGGAWQQADLATEVSIDTWRMWRARLRLDPGGHTVECRATDRNGYTQTHDRVGAVPDGATGWHSVFFTTV